MFKIIALILASISLFSFNSFAKDDGNYPNFSGSALFEMRADTVTKTNKNGVDSNNVGGNIDTNFNVNLNKNWSVISNLKFRQINQQSSANPERYRQILSSNRGFGMNDDGLIIEELKAQFANEDAKFYFGKFNPSFGTAHRKEKRLGVFATDFTKDYELREKLGGGFAALLENSEINVSAFFNDTTFLSDSAINSRGKAKRSDGTAGNTGVPNSYSVSIEGQHLFGVPDLFYNAGYRNQAVENMPGSDNETGFVAGVEYLLPLDLKTSIIPFLEIAKIDNLSGEKGRDSLFTTMALIAKYSGWTIGASHIVRDIEANSGNFKDKQTQYFVGYKFNNNIAVDLSHAQIKEDGASGDLIGLLVSYIYDF